MYDSLVKSEKRERLQTDTQLKTILSHSCVAGSKMTVGLVIAKLCCQIHWKLLVTLSDDSQGGMELVVISHGSCRGGIEFD